MKCILQIVLLVIPILLKGNELFPPPLNLQLQHWYAEGNYLQLSWDEPDTGQTMAQLMGYLLYRNFIFYDTLSSSSKNYLDFEPPFINDTIFYFLTAYYTNPDGESEPTDTIYHAGCAIGIENRDLHTPQNFMIIRNYPNPFNPITTIEYQIFKPGNIEISVFDIYGKKIEELINEKQTSGNYTLAFDGSKYPTGLYYYRVRFEKYAVTRRMVLLK
jgi:hypothetical protein